MSVWEYKVITSGKGGFATSALMESFLNQLGKDEWEIIHFHSPPDNALAFTGIARRSTQRDWTLEDTVAAAAKAEADKLRAEFEAKFREAATTAGPASEERAEAIAEKPGSDDGFRKIRDTERDLDPDSPDDEGEGNEWDQLAKEDELPTFFEAIQPLMRRNQRGAGMSAGVDHLAKKWGMSEDDVLGALKECGFAIPEDEDTKPEYVEYDGDLFWVNVNRRGEYWINTKEKPRAAFRIVTGTKIAPEEPSGDATAVPAAEVPAEAQAEPAAPVEQRRSERPERPERVERPQGKKQGPSLPEGPALLDRIRPFMRRNRGTPGGSGSVGFLSRALKCKETDLTAAFVSLGLALPQSPGEKHEPVEIGNAVWWLERDPRGAIWINGRDGKKEGTESPSGAPAAEDASGEAAPQSEAPSQSDPAGSEAPAKAVTLVEAHNASEGPDVGAVLAGVRLLLKETRTGAVAGEIGRLAESLGKSPDDFVAVLTRAGFKVPEKAREKPVFIERAGEIFWLNRNAKGELWLNAKASKFADGSEEGAPKKARRGKTAPKSTEDEPSA